MYEREKNVDLKSVAKVSRWKEVFLESFGTNELRGGQK